MSWSQFQQTFPDEATAFDQTNDWPSTDLTADDYTFTPMPDGRIRADCTADWITVDDPVFWYPDRDDWDYGDPID